MPESEIISFFNNQTVFLTGGTGFVGKVLVEKIFRVCDVKRLYLLVRPKKGISVEKRFSDYFNFPCFTRIQDKIDKNKVVFLEGDCEYPDLGLSENDKNVLISETNIVIHAAANVKFDQPLRLAANINVRSTIDLLNIAKKMSQLKSFIYVSTAFSSCTYKHIEEKHYPSLLTASQLFSILNGIEDDAILDAITPKLLQDAPNSYVFTKAIIESYINQLEKNFPIAIIKPSIVMGAVEEPLPGWIDNLYGIIGISVAVALGVLRTLHCDPANYAQVIPVDYVSNCIMAVCYFTGNHRENQVISYNVCLPTENLVSYEQYMNLMETYGLKYPTTKVLWYYSFKLTKNYYWNEVRIFFLHTVLAYIVDFFLIVAGRSPLAVKNYKKLDKNLKFISYFSSRNFTFDSKNVQTLWNQLNENDKQIFNFRKAINWNFYITDILKGGRIYLMKDPMETLPEGKRKLKILFYIHYTFIALFYFLLYKILKLLFSNLF